MILSLSDLPLFLLLMAKSGHGLVILPNGVEVTGTTVGPGYSRPEGQSSNLYNVGIYT